jgi:hypothetical protein
MQPDITRRLILKQTIAVPVWSLFATDAPAASLNLGQDWREVIIDLLDILIPEDTTPSASQLGVHEDIFVNSQTIYNYQLMLQKGAEWLNVNSLKLGRRTGFVSATFQTQEKLIDAALNSQSHSLPRVFIERVLQDAYMFYYQKQEAYSEIAGMRPIQPFGYPEHAHAPL